MNMPDQRRWPRIEPKGLVAKTAQIFLPPHNDTVECRVIDISAGGARLELPSTRDLPARFEVKHGGVRKLCALVWQRGYRFGIKFEGVPQLATGLLSRKSSRGV
jgi:hypothetical protein